MAVSGTGARTTRALSRRAQGGMTLPEVLVAIALVGLVVIALAAGLLTLVRATAANERRQQVQLALGNFGESLRGLDYLDCVTDPGGAGLAAYRSAYQAAPASWTPELPGMRATMVDVEYWQPSSRQFVAACPGTDHGAQRITLEVEWRDRVDRAQIVIGAR